MNAALEVLRDELMDAIDGGEECRGHDTRITRWINLCDLAMGKSIDPWAEMALAPDLRAKEQTMSRMADEMQDQFDDALAFNQDQQQWVEANAELEQTLESICRDYLTRGGKVEDVKFLASQLGISYAAITGGG